MFPPPPSPRRRRRPPDEAVMLGKRSRQHDLSSKTIVSSKQPAAAVRPLTSPPSPTTNDSAFVSKSTLSANEQLQSRFLQLPWELRSLIYTTTLAKPDPGTFLDLTHPDVVDVEPAFLATCRRVRAEALPIFYKCNDWIVKTRRVNNRIDPETRRPVLYEIVPRWVDSLPEEKIAFIARLVVIGTRGSFVDGRGVWREGGRAAFRLRKTKRGVGYAVEEAWGDEDERRGEELDPDRECGVRLVDLCRARMRCFGGVGRRDWKWTRDGVHEIACLL